MKTLLVLLAALQLARGHGYLKDPLNRASLWRAGIHGVPYDYEDNQQFCGGYQRQWYVNKGRCGICGDDYTLPRPRPYENMGVNSRGIVVKRYSPGATIRVSVQITACHLGHFRFHVCPLRAPNALEEEKCFTPLPLADGSGFDYPVKTWAVGEYSTEVVLPKGLTCERCVIRWQYTAGAYLCSYGTRQMSPEDFFFPKHPAR